jgi:hypothetical protein
MKEEFLDYVENYNSRLELQNWGIRIKRYC